MKVPGIDSMSILIGVRNLPSSGTQCRIEPFQVLESVTNVTATLLLPKRKEKH